MNNEKLVENPLLNLSKKLIYKSDWPAWGKLVVMIWIFVFVLAFIFGIMFFNDLWNFNDSKVLEVTFWIKSGAMIIAFLVTHILGSACLTRRHLRMKLYTSPETSALSCFTLSFLLSMGIIIILALLNVLPFCRRPSCTFFEDILPPIVTGLYFGIVAFPLTIGLVFPFGIPLACALIAGIRTRRNKSISPRDWKILVALSTLGWILVVIVGYGITQFMSA